MSVAVIIPFGGRCPYRARALSWQLEYYREEFPALQVAISHDESDLFSLAETTNAAVDVLLAKVDLLVLIGADSFVAPEQLSRAMSIASSAPGYVRAFSTYKKADKDYTSLARSWRELLEVPLERVEWMSEAAASPGVGVLRRECFDTVGGYDPKFQGWGFEDLAFMLSLEARWPRRYVSGDLVHHWHPRAESPAALDAEQRNLKLWRDGYLPRTGDPDALLELRRSTT